MDWAALARVMSQAPARIAGLDELGHGGRLAVGEPAHLTLVDPDAVVTVDADLLRNVNSAEDLAAAEAELSRR